MVNEKYTVEREGVLILEDNGSPKEFDTYEQAEFHCYVTRVNERDYDSKWSIRVPYPLKRIMISTTIIPPEEVSE